MIEQTMPLQVVKIVSDGLDLTELVAPTPTPLEHALSLFIQDTPQNAVLTIQETDGHLIAKYIFRMTYTSPKSGRSINMMAKGNSLPTDHDETYRYYVQQLILTPTEVARELSRIYFLERRSRQEAFLFSKNNIRVSDTGMEQDKLTFNDYA